MSNANYNFTVTRTQRMALAMKRLYTRAHIHAWSLEPVMLVPSPSVRVSTPLRAVLTLPVGTVAWVGTMDVAQVEDAAFIPTVRTKVFTTAALYPRRAGARTPLMLRADTNVSESVAQ